MADSLKRFLFSDDDDENSIFTRSASVTRCLSDASSVSRTKRMSSNVGRCWSDASSGRAQRMSTNSNSGKKDSLSATTDVSEEKTSSRSLIETIEKVTRSASNKVQSKKNTKKRFSLRGTSSGRWKPTDDLLLIISVLQVNDLDIVWNAAKFSCKFTLEDVRLRWKELLYDRLVSRTAIRAMRKLHPEQQETVYRSVPFSLEEEDLICDIISTDSPSLEVFQNLLDRNAGTFFHARTAKALEKHWRLLRKYELLCDQRPVTKTCASGEMPPTFENAEIDINIEAEQETKISNQEQIDCEMKIMDRQTKRKIRFLEDELGNWMQLVGSLKSTGIQAIPEFDSNTFAILHGQRLRFLMRTRLITFGRSTENGEDVDVDLSIEGPVHKVSRLQGAIEMHANGSFWTCNFGKRPFFVDGNPVFPKKMVLIQNNSVFDIFGISFILLLNKELTEGIYFKEFESN